MALMHVQYIQARGKSSEETESYSALDPVVPPTRLSKCHAILSARRLVVRGVAGAHVGPVFAKPLEGVY